MCAANSPIAEVFDGRVNSYIPAPRLDIDSSLSLHNHTEDRVDEITFEVLRHALWNVNDEHGVTIQKASGSPFANVAHDFNTVILTEYGEFVFSGAHIQYFSGTMDLPVKWTLENLSRIPGIRSGDMFLSNDPFIGASHQSDVQITCPMFVDGELFCWVANALHQYDVGGNTPGSFCPDARDVFDEPVPIPPIKIVEGGKIRPDLERMYLRHSRQPQLLALDLRAQIAGNLVACERIVSLVAQYGAATVKAAMYKVIDDGAKSFLTRLREIPDGRWSARTFLEAAAPGDRDIYPVTMGLTKKGDTLTFDNRGSHAQVGSLNSSFSGWRAGILSILNPLMCFDQLYAIGGALRHVQFEPEVGTINCPSFPASVTNSQIGNLIGGALANQVVGKMLLASPSLADEVFAVCGASVFPLSAIAGVDAAGTAFGTAFLDPMAGAIGAFMNRDGIDTGGVHWEPKSIMGNVEEQEQIFPILYLYRRELADAGGAGRYRGGNSAVFAMVPHGVASIAHAPSAAGCAVPTGAGFSGGKPACTNAFRMVKDSDVRARFATGEIPLSMDELHGREVAVSPKERDLKQDASDVWEVRWTAGGGYGDPLDRSPASVVDDIREGRVTAEWAHTAYGVCLQNDTDTPTVDDNETTALREVRRQERLRSVSRLVTRDQSDGPTVRVNDVLELAGEGGARHWRCSRCQTLLGDRSENYKAGAVLDECEITTANPHIAAPAALVDAPLVQRSYYCPGCAVTLETEIACADEPIFHDVEID